MRALVVLITMAAPVAAADLSVTARKTDPPAELARAVRAALDPTALVVADAEGAERMTVWFRATVPTNATAEQVRNGLTYREIPDGALVGAVRFARPFVDFRKQDVPAGVYTLRFAVQPDTGDHMGTAPNPEFVLLVPAEKDSSAEAVEVKTVVQRSATITEGDHPSVMLLVPYFDKANEPKVIDRGEGVLAVVTRRPVEAGGASATLGFALVVAGHSKTR